MFSLVSLVSWSVVQFGQLVSLVSLVSWSVGQFGQLVSLVSWAGLGWAGLGWAGLGWVLIEQFRTLKAISGWTGWMDGLDPT